MPSLKETTEGRMIMAELFIISSLVYIKYVNVVPLKDQNFNL